MSDGLLVLCGTAASIGFLHTLLGPDHYLPFVAMARAGQWSLKKTLAITLLCGLGHVLGSIVLGFVGIAFGIGVLKLEGIEAFRGDLAGWLLLAFGLTYTAWGVRRAIRHRPHTHWHAHADGMVHTHQHVHAGEHVHVHTPALTPHAHAGRKTDVPSMTPWILFTIFIFGPCEPLIPILMYPAAVGSLGGVLLVTAIFALTTLATMTTIVALAHTRMGAGRSAGWARWERFSHALAGAVVTACGLAIMLGW